MEFFKLLLKESAPKTLYLLIISLIAGITGGAIIPLVINTAEKAVSGKLVWLNIILPPVVAVLLILTKRISQQQTAILVGGIQQKLVLTIAGNVRHAELPIIENHSLRSDIFLRIVNSQQITNAATKSIDTFQNIIVIFICWLYIFSLSYRMSLILSLAFLFATIVYELFQKLTYPFVHKETDTEKEMFRSFNHILDGFKEIKMNRRKSNDLFHNYLTPLVMKTKEMRTIGMLYFSDFHLFTITCFFSVMGIYVYLFSSFASHEIIAKALTITLYITTPARVIIVSIPYIINGGVALNQLRQLADEKNVHKVDDHIYDPSKESIKRFQNITLDNIQFAYQKNNNSNGFHVGPLSLTIKAGEILFITGGNGSGKSTLLKLITGLYKHASGGFKIDGTIVPMTDHRYLFSAIFSDFHLFDALYGLDAVDDKRVKQLLLEMELADKTQWDGRRFTTIDLSNGQKKRLALIAALLEDKLIYVFDEWAADQAPHFRKYFYEHLLPSFKAHGKTVIAVTHDDNYFCAADRIIKMEYGKVVSEP